VLGALDAVAVPGAVLGLVEELCQPLIEDIVD
jgi:hypothetical protein